MANDREISELLNDGHASAHGFGFLWLSTWRLLLTVCEDDESQK